MEISNFIFDGISLADIDMIPGSINTDSQSMTPATLNFTVTTTPTSRTKRFVSSRYDNTISFEIGIVKDPCASQNPIIDIETDRFIRRWLIREDGFKIMRFECKDYEDILVNCYLNVAPVYLYGEIIGYTITGSTDSPYVSVEDYEKKFKLLQNGHSNMQVIQAISDEIGYLYPKIEITPKFTGLMNFGFLNDNTTSQSSINQENIEIITYDPLFSIDEEEDVETGITYIVKISFNSYSITVQGAVSEILSYDLSDYLPLSEFQLLYDESTNNTTISTGEYTWTGRVRAITRDRNLVCKSILKNATKIQAVANQTYVLDCDKSIITGLNNPNDFNWVFPRMQQDWNHSDQTFYCDKACDVKISYTPRRKVII